MASARSPAALAFQNASLVAALGAWAAGLAVLLAVGQKLHSLSLIVATMLPLAIFASGNARLFLLMGTVFSATLGLSINFQRHVIVGGAPSYAIDACDFFLIPLAFYIARDVVARQRHLRLPAVAGWWLALAALGTWWILEGPFRLFASFEVVRMLKLWLLFVVLVNECVREKQFESVVLALAFSVLFNAAIAFAQFVLGHNLGLQALGEPSNAATGGANLGVYGTFDVFRPGGVMGHPNLLSTYIAMTVPLFVAMLFTDTSPPMKLIYAVTSVAGTAALVLTLSRSGWIAFSAALGILMLVLYLHPILRGRRRRMKAALSTTLVIGLLIAAGPVLKRLLFSQSGALDFREMWVEVAWKMVKDHPLLGVGLNAFQLQQINYVPYSVGKMMKLFGENWPIVHNTYMIVWSEQGTLGLALLAALFIHLGVVAVAAARRLHDERLFLVACACGCGILAVAIDGLASFFIKVPASGRAFWIVAALLVAAYEWARDRERLSPLEQPIS